MKRMIYLLTLVAFAAFTYNSMAKVPIQGANRFPDYRNYINAQNPYTNIPLQVEGKNKLPETQAFTYQNVDVYESSMITHLSKCTPIAWDPVTNAIYVVGSERITNAQYQYIKAPIRVKKSINGTNWDSTVVFDVADWYGFFPSIAVTNYNSVNNSKDVPFTVYGMAYNRGTQYLNPMGGLLLAGTLNTPQEDIYLDNPSGPEDNNPGSGQRWQGMKLKDYTIDNESYVVGAGVLNPESAGYQYGNYGVYSWFVNNGNYNVTQIPSQWTDDKFRTAPSTGQSYQGPMEFDFDNNGVLYAAVNGMFVDDDQNRVPAVSVSEDLGANWTDFNRMPVSLIDNYQSGVGYDNANELGTYEMSAFVVTGTNKFSYFFRLGFFNTGDQNFQEIHLVEAYYDGTAWGIRKVADLNGVPQIFTISRKFTTQNNWVLKIDNDPIGAELQAVKTLDGNDILLKWIDLSMSFDINPPVTISGEFTVNDTTETETQISGTNTTDVFTCHRGVDENIWTNPVNNTNDTLFNKATWLPNVIPAINDVPMICSMTPFVTNQQHPLYGLNFALNMQIADVQPIVRYSRFDANVGVSSVKEVKQPDYINSLKDVYPNPAMGVAEISFILSQGANVKLQVFNSMGQLVKELINNYQSQGIHTYNLNTAEFSSGTYYYTLTTGTERETKILNIVR